MAAVADAVKVIGSNVPDAGTAALNLSGRGHGAIVRRQR
jgi:hypothetical protein